MNITKPIILHNQTPAQKNEKRMAINRRTGKPFPVTSKNVKDWQAGAYTEAVAWRIKNMPEPVGEKLFATYMFFVKDARRRDIDNMIASCNDVLVKAGILHDDSWQWLGLSGADAVIDSDNPRVEIHLDI